MGWLHNKQLLHGDITNDNILVFQGEKEPRVKIGDLGYAMQLDINGVDSSRRIQMCITTHKYAAPEMLLAGFARSEAITLSADVYSWGVLMMELIGNFHPLSQLPATHKEMDPNAALRDAYKKLPKVLRIINPKIDA